MKQKIGLGLVTIIMCFSLIGVPTTGKAEAQPAVPEDTADPICGSDPTLVGCWLFNEGTGTTTVDGSANTNDGTLVGNVSDNMWVADRDGNDNKALYFDGLGTGGNGQYVRVADSGTLDITGDITIAAWVDPKRESTQDLVKKATFDGIGGYELDLSALDGLCITPAEKPCAFGRLNQVPSGNAFRVDTRYQYDELDSWTFYVFTSNAADHTIRIYKNGALSTATDVTTTPTINSNSLYLGIGAQLAGIVEPLTPSRWFMGSLDDIRIYSRALSDAEILALYNNPTAISLVDISATSRPQAIQLDWQSAQEINLQGFNLFRADTLDGLQVKLNPQLIPAINPGQFNGNNYRYLDAKAEIGKTYYYWIEWVGNGGSESYGPVTASIAPFWVWLPFGLK